MSWDYELTERAIKQLKELGKPEQKRIFKFLDERILGKDDPREIGKALSGDYSGLWRYRVGDYRIVCELKDKVFRVLVVRIGHRKDIYD